MINRDIIDTDKKTPAENLGQLVKSTCIGFTVAMIVFFVALGTCFADDTAKQGINYCWSILAACVAVPALQFVFFTPAVNSRRMAYPARLVLFSVCLLRSPLCIGVCLCLGSREQPRDVGYLHGCLSRHPGRNLGPSCFQRQAEPRDPRIERQARGIPQEQGDGIRV